MADIFIAHSRYDIALRQWMDEAFAAEKVAAVRLEFEVAVREGEPVEILQNMLKQCSALLVLLGPQIASRGLHTSNWVAAEVGMARGLDIPIWVVEDWHEPINYPVPFVDHYVRLDRQSMEHQNWLRDKIRWYGAKRPRFPKVNDITGEHVLHCGNPECGSGFKIHNPIENVEKCPVCLTPQRWIVTESEEY